ncbi:MAG: DNA polymerase delta subunit 4-like protein [Monoraphidium minutum]|nr:MAG: DNA polymerase delta subunit 4-like protein [Monoraphidium minutum]
MSKVSDYFKQEKKLAGRKAPAEVAAPAPAQRAAAHDEPYTGLEPEGISEEEALLRTFDLTSKYGPCTGMSRLERWQRAARLGLEPPAEVGRVLEAAGADSPANSNIWRGRV